MYTPTIFPHRCKFTLSSQLTNHISASCWVGIRMLYINVHTQSLISVRLDKVWVDTCVWVSADAVSFIRLWFNIIWRVTFTHFTKFKRQYMPDYIHFAARYINRIMGRIPFAYRLSTSLANMIGCTQILARCHGTNYLEMNSKPERPASEASAITAELPRFHKHTHTHK